MRVATSLLLGLGIACTDDTSSSSASTPTETAVPSKASAGEVTFCEGYRIATNPSAIKGEPIEFLTILAGGMAQAAPEEIQLALAVMIHEIRTNDHSEEFLIAVSTIDSFCERVEYAAL